MNQTVITPHQNCEAFGCPLLGSMSTRVGSGPFFCRHHYGKDPSKNAAITEKIKRYLELFEYLELAKNGGRPQVEAYDRYVRSINRADLAPTQVLNRGNQKIDEWLQTGSLYYRVHSTITREIRES
jgi:hypothetical protein